MARKIFQALIFILLLSPGFVWAGPGGKIARVVAETFWGKVILAGLTIIFLPLVLFVVFKEYKAKKRVLKDLSVVSALCPDFDWIKLRNRIQDCFYRVHAGLGKKRCIGIK